IGFPLASRAVTVIVEDPLPAAMDVGAATTVDWDAETPPGVTVTVTLCATETELLIVADTVLSPAAVEASVPVATPSALVVPTGCVRVFPVVGVAARTTVAPSIGFPCASLAVTVRVDVALPAAIDVGAAATVD